MRLINEADTIIVMRFLHSRTVPAQFLIVATRTDSLWRDGERRTTDEGTVEP